MRNRSRRQSPSAVVALGWWVEVVSQLGGPRGVLCIVHKARSGFDRSERRPKEGSYITQANVTALPPRPHARTHALHVRSHSITQSFSDFTFSSSTDDLYYLFTSSHPSVHFYSTKETKRGGKRHNRLGSAF